MAVALRGNLQDFGIAEVFQLIGQQRKTGLLKISHERRVICLAFDSGSVVWARPSTQPEHEVLGQRLIRCGYLTSDALSSLYTGAKSSGRSVRALLVSEGVATESDLETVESLVTHDTIFEVLRWTRGSFDFLSQAVRHNRPKEKLLGAEQILMDGLRMVDEWQTFCGSVPPLESVLEHRGSIETYREQNRRDGDKNAENVEKIYQLVDGRLTLQRIIDLSRLGIFDASRIVADMIGAGLIVGVEAKQTVAPGRELQHGRSLGQGLAFLVAASVPMMVLGAMVVWIHLQGAARTEQIEAFPIQRQTFDRVHALFDKRRIRHAVEAHRYLTGDWPLSLAELDGSGPLGNAMAADSSAAYYYSRYENEIVLLAPER
ncbi:MAG: DUF4388 domain-containing protein [Deltaproteobacteria bacterium]|nr:DUF4388 domain-containing protein [Deltaproteobacteria bacterium]MBW2693285.1 DUF4388 domain-containing protein [Deltaproteobacteria bacterium]